MIIVNLGGGLGNQMFMYAFGRAQAQKYNDKLYFSTYSFSKDKLGRRYRLDQLNIYSGIQFIDEHKLLSIPFIIKRLCFEFIIRLQKEDRLNMESMMKYAKKGYFFFGSGEYVKPIYAHKLVNYYNNTFQSEKYFENIKEEIKREFRAKIVSGVCKEYAEALLKPDTVCVHIRRSDFCVNPTLNVCGKKYYLDAIEKIKKMVENPKFYLFSEDMEWVKAHFSGDEFTFVDIAQNEVEDLYMMYHCQHFIIPNSSFSWWAQYLTIHEGRKVVIAPEYWYPSKGLTSNYKYNNKSDLYFDDWTLIKPTPWQVDEI